VIDDRLCVHVIKEGVDREVATERILFRRAEDVVVADEKVVSVALVGRRDGRGVGLDGVGRITGAEALVR
jgi:hypothetical protein